MVGLASDFSIERTEIADYYPTDQRAFVSDVIVKSMLERGHWEHGLRSCARRLDGVWIYRSDRGVDVTRYPSTRTGGNACRRITVHLTRDRKSLSTD